MTTRRSAKKGAKQNADERHYEHSIPSRADIVAALERAPGPLGLESLGRSVGIESAQHLKALENRLKAMVRDGQLIRNRAKAYGLTSHLDLVVGTVLAHRDGYGFLRPDGGGDDLYLSAREMRTLWDRDRVAARSAPGRRGGLEGRVVEVLDRGKTHIVGRFRLERGIAYVLDEGDSRAEVLIGRGDTGGAKSGDIVKVEIIEYPTARSHAIGRVVQQVGRFDQPGVETDVAIISHGIPSEWPEDVGAMASALPKSVTRSAKKDRVDLRDLPLVTIDGATAKDFDDAVYCEPQGEGWRLIVAIADVSHYVVPGSPLDAEASSRGTSVYFPDRVVPMLPEALSNGLCSLNPRVDRLCMVCDMQVSTGGAVKSSRFYEGLMRSAARLTYSGAWDILNGAKLNNGINANVKTALEHLHAVYGAFAKARHRRGAIDFDLPEAVIQLDDRGQVDSIHPAARLPTHKLIEECMIAANVEAAKQIRRSRLPSLYRVHEEPDEERIEELSLFLGTLGAKLHRRGKLEPKYLSRLLEGMHGKPEAELFEGMLLRSMKQAAYQPKNVGHFGLALGAYAHFTSPIRRYPDLLVHRAIKQSLKQRTAKGYAYSMPEMEQLGERCSMAERRANKAVWDVEEQLKCRFMQNKIGENFSGIVSGIVPFGLFVRIPELQIDGLVHVSALPRDYYHRDPSGTRLQGERTGTEFRLTEALEVRLVRVDLEERKIDFALADVSEPVAGEARERKQRARRRG